MSHLLTVFNSSVNFYIYLVKHGRREFRIIGAEIANRTTGGTTDMVVSNVDGVRFFEILNDKPQSHLYIYVILSTTKQEMV